MRRMDGATMTREIPNTARTPHCHIPRTRIPPEQSDGDLPPRTESGLHTGDRHVGSTPRPNRGSGRLGASIRRFWRNEHGGAAIESAVTLLILVVGFAGLMEIVQVLYTDDRMSRAARAAARVLALNPAASDEEANNVACATIRRELSLPEDFDCTAWDLGVYQGISPETLPDPLTPDGSVARGTGDMVLVRIGWKREPFSFGGLVRDAHAEEDAGDEDAGSQSISVAALGLARCEAELCGQTTS